MEVISHSTQETKDLAVKLAGKLKPGAVLALYGDLGSGKTTFTRFLVEALGFDSKVQSPTFIVARKYTKVTGDIKIVNHIDLYRLGSKEEVADLGLIEFFEEPEAITIIEWPEVASGFLSDDTISIKFETIDEGVRKICIGF